MDIVTNFEAWQEIAEKIATETIYNHEQADEFVQDLALHGADAAKYGERLYNAVCKTSYYKLARIRADMVFF